MKNCLMFMMLFSIGLPVSAYAGFYAKKIGLWPGLFTKKACMKIGAVGCLSAFAIDGHASNQSKQEKLQREKLRYEQEWVDIVEKSQKMKEVDPQFWNIFCQVKRDLGISEDIEVRVVPYNYVIRGDDQFNAMYVFDKHAILLRAGYRQESYSKLIYTLAHELEHHRQSLEYHGSYHGFNRAKQEHAADAAAAGYIQCAECLRTMATYHRCRKNNDLSGFDVEEKILKRMCLSTGYFGPKDFEPYIMRAVNDHCLCQAHQVDANIDDKCNLQNYVPVRDE